MARIKYVILRVSMMSNDAIKIMEAGIVSSYEDKDGNIILARYGVNKTTLRKILEKYK